MKTNAGTKTTQTATPKASAGLDGASITPPAYGIEGLDLAAFDNAAPMQMKTKRLPDVLKTGLEALSSMSLDEVRTNRAATGHGTHEAWHTTQQKQSPHILAPTASDISNSTIQRKYQGRTYPNGRPDLTDARKSAMERRALFAEIIEADVTIYDQTQNIYKHGDKATKDFKTEDNKHRLHELKAVIDAFDAFKVKDLIKGRIGLTVHDAEDMTPSLITLCDKLNLLEEGDFARARDIANRVPPLDAVISARNVYGLTVAYTRAYTGHASKAHAPHGANFNANRTVKQILDNIMEGVTTDERKVEVEKKMKSTWSDYTKE